MTGEQQTKVNTLEGPLMVFITTTQVDIDGETDSRFVFASIDESEDMTKKVLAKQRQNHTIAGYVLGRALDELNPSSRKLLMMIKDMCKKNTDSRNHHFNRRQIREHSGWSDFQVRTHIRQIEDFENIYSVTGKRGKEYVYELVYKGEGSNGQPFVIGLTVPLQLRIKQHGLCLSARTAGL
jgi:hypothetical protein